MLGLHQYSSACTMTRLAFGEDEREVAGGLLGEPLQTLRTPKYGLRVPAYAEIVFNAPARRVCRLHVAADSVPYV